jgi:hypothetical protein
MKKKAHAAGARTASCPRSACSISGELRGLRRRTARGPRRDGRSAYAGTSLSQFYSFSFKDLEELVASGAHFKIPTYANKSRLEQAADPRWENCNLCAYQRKDWRQDDPAFHEKALHEDYYRLFRKMGMMTSHSCANYLTMSYLPSVGQHCAWFESSQIPVLQRHPGRARTSTAALPPVFWERRRITACISRKTGMPPSW